MLCGDEKSQIQALDRTAPIFPTLPGTPERATHDYKRAGTSSLYAALDITSGKVIGALHSRHRAKLGEPSMIDLGARTESIAIGHTNGPP